MKYFPFPALSALKRGSALRTADVTALINQTLAANLPGARTAQTAVADVPMTLNPLRGLLPHLSPDAANPGLAGNDTGSGEGRFVDHVYREGGRMLAYRLYIPAGATTGMPLVVMLHGCTQSAEDFARGTGMNLLAEKLGFLVAYPSQTHAANPQKCWNWFKPTDQQRGRGEPALIAGLTQEIVAKQGCDGARIYVAGLSAGGAAAAIMADAYPDIYAAVGIHSGLPCGAARDIPSALMAMQQGGTASAAQTASGRFVPVITFHGDADRTVSDTNSRNIVAAATRVAGPLIIETQNGTVAGGRRFTCERSIDRQGVTLIERWTIHGGGHAWSGGAPSGTYTDGLGPDASAEMMRFFLSHRIAAVRT